MSGRAGPPAAGRSGRLPLGPALRRAWIGYQQLLEAEMAAEGVERRDFPDGRVLHICARSPHTTISAIGRELGITRQGASKIVGLLLDQGFVTVQVSGREKLVTLTQAATTYLDVQRKAAQTIERRLKSEVGRDAFEALYDLLDRLGGEETPRLRAFLRTRSNTAIRLE